VKSLNSYATQNVHHCVQKIPLLVPILTEINLVQSVFLRSLVTLSMHNAVKWVFISVPHVISEQIRMQ
jgi:hypothetical protein